MRFSAFVLIVAVIPAVHSIRHNFYGNNQLINPQFVGTQPMPYGQVAQTHSHVSVVYPGQVFQGSGTFHKANLLVCLVTGTAAQLWHRILAPPDRFPRAGFQPLRCRPVLIRRKSMCTSTRTCTGLTPRKAAMRPQRSKPVMQRWKRR